MDEGETVTLSGSNSHDPDGTIDSYEWTQVHGIEVELSDPNAAQPIFLAPDVGPDGESLTFQLIVTDNCGLQTQSGDTCIVNVSWVNVPPTALAGDDQTVHEGSTVILDGSESTDPDDGIAFYLWTQSDGPSISLSDETSVQSTFTAPDVGPDGEALTFELTVTDNGGLQATDTCIVNVTWENDPPTADAGPDQEVDEGETVTLDGSGSTDPDPDDGIASYLWTQTEGTPVTLSNPASPETTFIAPSVASGATLSLTFQLTVEDNGGLKANDEVSITINDNGTPPPPIDDCPISLTVCGSPMEPYINVLREFRDCFLNITSVGRAFVDLYYAYSPPTAGFIARHDNFRAAVRWSLLPVVGVSWVALKVGPVPSLALMLLLIFGLGGIVGFSWRKVKK